MQIEKDRMRIGIMDYILLILGFVLLIKGADYFVDGSSSVARILKVPTIIIGLTVVAFGTSMPELSVSVTAALKGENDLAVSNVLGSNIFNLLVVLGCCALVNPVQAKWSLLKKEFPFSIFVAVILLLLNSDFSVTKVLSGSGTFVLGRWGGMLFLILFGMFLYATVREALTSRDGTDEDEGEAGTDNVVGSNIFNILLILGVSATITPIVLDVTAVYDTLILIAASLIVYGAALSKREIRRNEGALFLLAYLTFFVYILGR